MTGTRMAAHGDIELRLKGYTSAEHFQVDVYNYTSAAYDTAKMEVDDLSNTWQADVDLCDDHHRRGTSSKVKITDMTAAASDTTQDTLYLDVLWVSRTFTNPVISAYRAANIEITEGEDVVVWATYSDYDDQAHTSMRAHCAGSDGGMAA